MKKKNIYPAVIEVDSDKYMVSFPDLPGCLTDGDSVIDAYQRASEVLALHLDDIPNPPVATDIAEIRIPGGGYVMYITADDNDDIRYLDKNVGAIMADKMKTKGVSNYRLAKNLDISESYVSLLMAGKRTPSPDIAKKIAAELGFDWKLFFKGDNGMES
mgnify:CR=1 FL=1